MVPTASRSLLGRVSPLLVGRSNPLPDSSSQRVRTAEIGSQLGNIRHRPLTPLPVRRIHNILFRMTLYTLFTIITFHMAGQLGCFIGWIHNNLYYITNTSALYQGTRQTESLHLSPQGPPPVRRELPTMITRGCYGNLGPLSVAHTYNTRTPISTICNMYITSADRYTTPPPPAQTCLKQGAIGRYPKLKLSEGGEPEKPRTKRNRICRTATASNATYTVNQHSHRENIIHEMSYRTDPRVLL